MWNPVPGPSTTHKAQYEKRRHTVPAMRRQDRGASITVISSDKSGSLLNFGAPIKTGKE
jgi:hypothetical protein